MPANLENSAVATGLENVSFHSNPKECSNYHTIAPISHASKIMLKILQARLQQYVTCRTPGYLPNRGIEPVSPASALAGRFFITGQPGKS